LSMGLLRPWEVVGYLFPERHTTRVARAVLPSC
jgi:hypothetical protein